MASIEVIFTNGTRLTAEYWRLVIDGGAGLSSFDHQQNYGLRAPIDAVKNLSETLRDKLLTNAILDHMTGDLLFDFDGNVSLQVFNFTGYEIWHIRFPDGTREYSNSVK